MKMPKLKTKRAAAKRFKKTGTGQLKRMKAYKSHILTKKSQKRKRNLRKATFTDATNAKVMKKILPYFAKRKLSDITARDIIDWQNEICNLTDCHGKPLSKTYLKTVHNQLSAIFNHAIRYYGL